MCPYCLLIFPSIKLQKLQIILISGKFLKYDNFTPIVFSAISKKEKLMYFIK